MAVLVINGPNLGRLGLREVSVYGSGTHDDLVAAITGWGRDLGLTTQVEQYEDEGQIIAALHRAVDDGWDVVLNAGAYTHYSIAIRDAATQVTSAGLRLVEVHLSNTAAREEFRHTSVIAPVATGVIAGFGFNSYRAALFVLCG